MRVMLLTCICRNSGAVFAFICLSESCGAFLCSSMAVAIFEHEATGQFGCSCVISTSPVQFRQTDAIGAHIGTLLLRVEGNTLRMRKSGLLSLEPETGRIVDSELAISASLIGELARANEVLPTLAQPVSVSE